MGQFPFSERSWRSNEQTLLDKRKRAILAALATWGVYGNQPSLEEHEKITKQLREAVE